MYVQCIPSWGIPAMTTQIKTAETNTGNNSIAAAPLCSFTQDTDTSEVFSLHLKLRVKGGVEISCWKRPDLFWAAPKWQWTQLSTTIRLWGVYLNKTWVKIHLSVWKVVIVCGLFTNHGLIKATGNHLKIWFILEYLQIAYECRPKHQDKRGHITYFMTSFWLSFNFANSCCVAHHLGGLTESFRLSQDDTSPFMSLSLRW